MQRKEKLCKNAHIFLMMRKISSKPGRNDHSTHQVYISTKSQVNNSSFMGSNELVMCETTICSRLKS